MNEDRIEMSQRERDRLKVMASVLSGRRRQREAARLLKLSVRQVRRIQRRLEAEGDGAVIHRLRGRPSNRRQGNRRTPVQRQPASAVPRRLPDVQGGRTLPGGSAPRTPGVYRFRGPRPRDAKRKAAPPRRHGPLPFVPPKDARVALLRSPVLPLARPILPPPSRTVQVPIIRGEKASPRPAETGHFYWASTADISNGA